jgi:hypothetical protein
MKKLILLAALSAGFAAQAEIAGPAWTCQLAGSLAGKSIGAGLSVARLNGMGTVTCMAVDGTVQIQNVALKVRGLGLGVGYSEYVSLTVFSAGVGLASPTGMVGTYTLGPAVGVTLIDAGLDFNAALKVSSERGIGFEVGLAGKEAKGLEVKLQLQSMKITAAE